MAATATGLQGFKVFLEMVKIEHSVFALPFALIGMMWGSVRSSPGAQFWPGWDKFLLVVVAMVSCRTAAMAYNRIADRDIDAKNPRTRMRAIPTGLLSLRTSSLYFFGSCAVFFFAALLLNQLAFALSPVALGVTLFYSVTKRFTPLCHFILGLSLGIAPAAAWIAVTGRLDPAALWLVGAVALWTAGFDIIYSLQDEEFDRSNSLRSLPETLGGSRALVVSRVCHVLAFLLLLGAGLSLGGPVAVLGAVGVGVVLVYEQSLVRADDLSRVNLAFFTLNGLVSIGYFVFVLADLALRKR